MQLGVNTTQAQSYVNQLEKKFGLAAKNELENTTKVSLKRKLLGD